MESQFKGKDRTVTADLYAGDDLETLADMPNYHGWMMDAFAPFVRGHVVEYGAGIGTISALLLPHAERMTLVEPSANLVRALERRFSDTPRVSVVGSMLEAHAASLAPGSADTVVLVNVLEHVEDDAGALHALMVALRPGGSLLLFVPALRFLMSRLDRSLGHFRRYHRPDLVAKTQAAGFAVASCRYLDLFGVAPWFLLNTLLGSMSFDPKLVRINDRYVVPLSRRVESLIPPPFGKNLLLVARKP